MSLQFVIATGLFLCSCHSVEDVPKKEKPLTIPMIEAVGKVKPQKSPYQLKLEAEIKRKEAIKKELERKRSAEFTFYSHNPLESESKYYNGRILTSTGIDLTDSYYYKGYRVLAVNPEVIPYGSILNVTIGDWSFKGIAIDTGGAIVRRNDLIDVMVKDDKEARKLGRQKGTWNYVRKGW